MPKILFFRLNIKSFGDLAMDAIFIRQLPTSYYVFPLYPPLIQLRGHKNFSNENFIKRVFSDILIRFSAPTYLVWFINKIFQLSYIFIYIFHFFLKKFRIEFSLLDGFLRGLIGRSKLFSELTLLKKEDLFCEKPGNVSSNWWVNLKLPDELVNDLVDKKDRLVVIHHRPESNGGLVRSSVLMYEKAIADLVADGFLVLRIKDSNYESLIGRFPYCYHELNIDEDKENLHLKFIENSTFFIGGSSGPIWVSLYFCRPTFQLNYTDFFLNGPFLEFHYVSPMNLIVRPKGKKFRFINLLNLGAKGHFFGKNLVDDLELLSLNSAEVAYLVRKFRKRLCHFSSGSGMVSLAEQQLAEARSRVAGCEVFSDQLLDLHGHSVNWEIEVKRIRISSDSAAKSFLTRGV